MRAALPHATMDHLKDTMWPFRKRPADLESDEQDRRTRLFAHAPQLKQAYDLREQLTAIFDTARSKAEGLRRIHRWRRAGDVRGLPCFDPFLKRLDTGLDLMANDFRQRQTSGVVEGLNNKLKGLKRRCFGIYNLRHLCQRITLDLDGYRRFSPWQGAHHSIWALPRQVLESPKVFCCVPEWLTQGAYESSPAESVVCSSGKSRLSLQLGRLPPSRSELLPTPDAWLLRSWQERPDRLPRRLARFAGAARPSRQSGNTLVRPRRSRRTRCPTDPSLCSCSRLVQARFVCTCRRK